MVHFMLFSILLLHSLLLITFRQDIYNYIPETNMRLGYIVLQHGVVTIYGTCNAFLVPMFNILYL